MPFCNSADELLSTVLSIVGYVRKSTDEPDKQIYSLDSQVNSIKEVARVKGWQLAPYGFHYLRGDAGKLKGDPASDGFYIDGGITGTIFNRPALQRMRHDAKGTPSPFPLIMMVAFDRIARDNADSSFIRKELAGFGVKVAETSAPDMDSSSLTGKMIYGIKGVIAEYEHDINSERTSRAMKFAAGEGRHMGKPKVGFEIDSLGRLTLAPLGKRALELFKLNKEISAAILNRELEMNDYHKAWNLLQNIKGIENAN